MSNLYQKHNYLNKDIKYLSNTNIREYDMKAGGFSILKRAGCLSEKEINFLSSCSKLERNIYLGNKVKNNPELNEIQMNGFIEARQLFLEANNISDESILSIKKDALFIIKDVAKVTEIDGFTFNMANMYNSYYYINEMEFYYSTKTNSVDIKGLGKANIPLHQDYFIKDLCRIFSLAEKNNNDYLIKYLAKYRLDYINKDLPLEHYRELNNESGFRLLNKLGGEDIIADYIDDIDMIDHRYNYIKYIIPLISYYL